MDKTERIALLNRFYQLVEDHSGITKGKFFGVQVLRVEGQMFLVVTEQGHVALRAMDPEFRQQLSTRPDADEWRCHNKLMSQWVKLSDYNDITDQQWLNWMELSIEQVSLAEL